MLRKNLWLSVIARYSSKAFLRSNLVVERVDYFIDNYTDRLLRLHAKLECLAMTVSSSDMTT